MSLSAVLTVACAALLALPAAAYRTDAPLDMHGDFADSNFALHLRRRASACGDAETLTGVM